MTAPGAPAPTLAGRALDWVAAPAFVAIWSTGFVVARAVKGAIDPELFLTARFGLTGVMFLAIALALGVQWPRGREMWRHALAGVLLNGLYLGPSYWAVAHGLPAAVMALIGAMQPLLVASAARIFLGERALPRTWLGLLIGVGGTALVIVPRLAAGDGSIGSLFAVLVSVTGIFSMTAGTLLQKTRMAGADLRASSALQNFGGASATAVLALLTGEGHFATGPAQWASLGWAVFVLSGMGTTLLVWMVRGGNATRATSLLLLVPPLVAVETYVMFGETLTWVQIAGFAVALAGVRLARR